MGEGIDGLFARAVVQDRSITRRRSVTQSRIRVELARAVHSFELCLRHGGECAAIVRPLRKRLHGVLGKSAHLAQFKRSDSGVPFGGSLTNPV